MVKKKQGNRLLPLNEKIEDTVFNADERKLSHQLNLFFNKHVPATDLKKRRSKIPVLQKKEFYPKQSKDSTFCDVSLSAADRRQKFQQSHLRVGGASTSTTDPVLKNQPVTQYYYDLFPWYEGYILHKIVPPPASVISQKNVLPPIKPVNVSTGTQKTNTTKNKSLLGEFTHFPALCNPVYLKDKKQQAANSVPHLPPIMQLPPAPPPSISTSTEKDGNHVNKKALNNKLNTARHVLQNVIPVAF